MFIIHILQQSNAGRKLPDQTCFIPTSILRYFVVQIIKDLQHFMDRRNFGGSTNGSGPSDLQSRHEDLENGLGNLGVSKGNGIPK